MVDRKQKGKPTYRRDMVRWIWNPKSQANDLFKIVNKFGKKYYPSLPISNVDINEYEKWTLLGPAADISVKINKNYKIELGCYRDGWHITLHEINISPNYHLRQSIFGDKNSTTLWTQETEKVSEMMGQLFNDLERYFEENE
jgi:hypothetical protein